jgi:NAD(P)-dependent dehydrogenase (short-subunit alcohol dehydrogenase family)
MADVEMATKFDIATAVPYSVSKAALNMLTAKYHIAYGKSEGILFLGISPGLVATSEGKSCEYTPFLLIVPRCWEAGECELVDGSTD